MIKNTCWLSLVLFMLGCTKGKNKDFVPGYDVPAEFQPVVSGFIHEAALRGDTLVINNLIIKYDSSQSNMYCALCNTLSSDPGIQKLITVNPKIKCYENAQEFEVLFFHELGHCILGRNHDNRLLPNGDPRSIMVEDKRDLYSPCLYPIGGSCQDNTYKRTYYLDELFDENTAIPQWAR
ncbi:MAG: hypothetical protein JST09_09970 [Bacteroidetes bacterium]|nr:hypothetical protein [Bacteroidota bacterium]